MKLRFFADHCIPNSVIQAISSSGYEVFRLKDHILQDSEDSLVIRKAQEINSILLSLNGDFSDIVAYPPSEYNGIITLQLKNHPEIISKIIKILNTYFSTHTDMEHYKGKLFIVEPHRIRIKQ
jgi:predicted nuclease of predicted toxin-antitoxin system